MVILPCALRDTIRQSILPAKLVDGVTPYLSLPLSGFTCRCGGLYCSIHRYSDKHQCDFDYKEAGAAEIRKSNPVVVAKKVQQI